MSRRSSLVLVLWIAAAVAAIVALVPVVRYYTSTTTSYSWDRMNRVNMGRLQGVQPCDVRGIYIFAGFYGPRGRQPMSVWLDGGRDREDVANLLAALKEIRISDGAMRIPAVWERIVIDAGNTKVHVYGYFDPARTPVISPRMRSDDVAAIVQDILRRKGKKLRRDGPTRGGLPWIPRHDIGQGAC